MVEQLEDIKGYDNLSIVDKVKYAVALKAYLDDLNPDMLNDMDILEVRTPKFKLRKSLFYCVFLIGDKKQNITIEFKKSMMYTKK